MLYLVTFRNFGIRRFASRSASSTVLMLDSSCRIVDRSVLSLLGIDGQVV